MATRAKQRNAPGLEVRLSADPSLFLATPCYGGAAHVTYLRSLLALEDACARRRVPLQLDLGGGEALIGRARAGMLARFLASQASHLLFVDADIGFAPEAVFRLLGAGKDLIGGVYPRKALKTSADAIGPPLEYAPLSDSPPSSLDVQPVAAVGAGFLLVSRSAAQQITQTYPQLRARLGDVSDAGAAEAVMVFDSLIDPQTRRYLADHEAFCLRWRQLGGEVWADFGCGLSHVADLTVSAPLAAPAV